MMPFTPDGFRDMTVALPAVTLHEQWGSLVAKVGGKVFALLSLGGAVPAVVFKVPEESFEMMTGEAGITQAAYFAKRQWVAVAEGAALSGDEIAGYVARSHRIIAGKLTQRARAELGL